jgi:very-short-patch-repair endonuclease
MSKIANTTADILAKMFPDRLGTRVTKEIYVNFEGTRLFFDFYIKELRIYIEIQGGQHTKFVKHFHGDKETFLKQKHRDNLKIQYVQENDKCLIRFNYDEDITGELIMEKITKVLENGCFYE